MKYVCKENFNSHGYDFKKTAIYKHLEGQVALMSEGQVALMPEGSGILMYIDSSLLSTHFKPVEQTKLADRRNEGKIPLSYLFDFPKAMLEFCCVCMNGAKKYNRDNWKKGRPYRDTIDSLLRHVEAFQSGEGFYEETLPSGEVVKFHHLANAMWNCAALLEWSLSDRKDLDDRYKNES